MLAKPDPSTFQVLPWRGEGPATRPDVLRHPDARRLAVLRRPALRAQAHAGQGRRPGLHLLHPPRDRVLPVQGPARRDGTRARAGRPQRLLRPHRRRASPTTSAARRSRCWSRWASRSSSATTRARPGQQEIDLRYADALTTADNIMTFRLVVKEVALSQGIYASFMPKPFTDQPGSGMHTHLSLFEGDRNAFYEAGAGVPAVQDRPRVHRRPAAARGRDHRGHQPVGQLLQAAAPAGGRGAGVRLLGAQQPLGAGAGADVQADQGPVDPGRGALARLARPTRTWPSRCMLAAGLKGIEEGYELPPERRGRRLVADRGRAPGAGHRAAAGRTWPRRST